MAVIDAGTAAGRPTLRGVDTPRFQRPCAVCGRETDRHWCSTDCYMADEGRPDREDDWT